MQGKKRGGQSAHLSHFTMNILYPFPVFGEFVFVGLNAFDYGRFTGQVLVFVLEHIGVIFKNRLFKIFFCIFGFVLPFVVKIRVKIRILPFFFNWVFDFVILIISFCQLSKFLFSQTCVTGKY